MLDVRKKLTSYLPNSARNHLQNVLTVEWGQDNKTVLVDVTGQNNDRSDEVELSGLTGNAHAPSRDRSEYGRLDDDEHEVENTFNRPTLGKPKTSWTNATLYGTQGITGTGGRFRSGSSASRKSASRAGAGDATPPGMGFSASSCGPYSPSLGGGGGGGGGGMYGYDGEYQYPSGPGARERDRNAHTYRESDNENDHAYPSGPTGNGYRRNESDNPFDENSPTYASGLAEADAAFEAEFGRKPSPSPLYAQPGSGASRGAAPARLSGLGQGPGLGQGQGQGQEQRQRQSSGRMLPPRLDGAARGASGAQDGTMGPLGGGTQGGVGSGSKNDPWGSGGWSGHTSPTSSRGTRGSAQMDENPFR